MIGCRENADGFQMKSLIDFVKIRSIVAPAATFHYSSDSRGERQQT
jgi:hypothetical protein